MAPYRERMFDRCARCGQPRWKHSKWAQVKDRQAVHDGGCADVEAFVEPKAE